VEVGSLAPVLTLRTPARIFSMWNVGSIQKKKKKKKKKKNYTNIFCLPFADAILVISNNWILHKLVWSNIHPKDKFNLPPLVCI
jgi:hypothetical protein